MGFPILERDISGYPRLGKDYRGIFPFRLATTSYIYPDYILPNARLLSPYLDEMELVLFESRNLPTAEEISGLCALHSEGGFSYHVHLPLDISLGHPSAEVRRQGLGTVKEIVALTGVLGPSCYTLHYVLDDACRRGGFSSWRRNIYQSTEAILEMGLDPAAISVEILDYPLTWLEDIIEGLGLSICLDFGHIVQNGDDPGHYLDKYRHRTSVIHLQGVDQGRDHLGLEVLDEALLAGWLRRLRAYTGTVSIEVFCFDYLQNSLAVLEKRWAQI